MMKTFVSALLMSLAALAQAQTTQPDLAKGSAIVTQVCAACHGADGNGTPKLAGQHMDYLVKQLNNFKATKDAKGADKAPERANAVMGGFAAALSKEDIRNVAAFYSAQTLKPASGKNKDLMPLGAKIWRGGIADKGVAACASCHGPAGKGMPAQYPAIGGQWGEYTEAQLIAFRQGSRKNSAQMNAIAVKMTDAEIKAVSDYAASLR